MISKANLRFFTSLQERRYRQESGFFVVEGIKPLEEAFKCGMEPEWMICNAAYAPSFPFYNLCEPISDPDFKKISSLKSPEGLLGVFPLPISEENTLLPAFALESIQDPGNVGAIIRIADWFGIPSVICSPDTADPWQPKVVRASMGSLFRTRVKVVSDFQDFLLRESKSLVLANMEGEPLSAFQFPKEAIMVLGNEGQGLSAKIQNLTEAQKVNIPGSGNAESLNVSVAAGIFAWQYYQQNHGK